MKIAIPKIKPTLRRARYLARIRALKRARYLAQQERNRQRAQQRRIRARQIALAWQRAQQRRIRQLVRYRNLTRIRAQRRARYLARRRLAARIRARQRALARQRAQQRRYRNNRYNQNRSQGIQIIILLRNILQRYIDIANSNKHIYFLKIGISILNC